MYTFNAIPSVPVEHVGFGIIAFMTAVFWLMMLYSAKEEGWSVAACGTILMAIPVTLAYFVSYEWTNQEPKVYANTKVEGKFVQFVTESHNEYRSSGKTHTTVTVRNQYVVYEVNGQQVMLPASLGVTYPPVAILYKN